MDLAGRIDAVGSFAVAFLCFFFFQAEDGIRDLVRSRGLGDVYKRQALGQSRCVSGMRRPCVCGPGETE